MNRNKKFKDNFLGNLIYKILGIFLSFIMVPIILNYLGVVKYGIWMTIFSVVNWIYLLDGGIGLGLRNNLTKSITLNQIKKSKAYICSAYIGIMIFSFIFLVISITLTNYINIMTFFNLTDFVEKDLKKVCIIILTFTLFNFFLSIYKQLYYSVHESSKVNQSNILYQCCFVISLLGLIYFYKEPSLIYLAWITGISMILPSIVYTYYFFIKNNNIKPSFKDFRYKEMKQNFSVGSLYFIIQISLIVILSTDNLIIGKFVGMDEVTTYSIIQKIYMLFITLFSTLTSTIWSLYTDAFIKKDFLWIKLALKRQLKVLVLIIISMCLLVFILPIILKIWLRKDLVYSIWLPINMGVFILFRIIIDIYAVFLNGIGEIKLQTILFLIGAIVNIPLSIFFSKTLGYGSIGVIFATNCSLLLLVILLPIQVQKIIKRRLNEETVN